MSKITLETRVKILSWLCLCSIVLNFAVLAVTLTIKLAPASYMNGRHGEHVEIGNFGPGSTSGEVQDFGIRVRDSQGVERVALGLRGSASYIRVSDAANRQRANISENDKGTLLYFDSPDGSNSLSVRLSKDRSEGPLVSTKSTETNDRWVVLPLSPLPPRIREDE